MCYNHVPPDLCFKILCHVYLFVVQDLLQQPAMLFLNQDAEVKRKIVQSKQDQKFLDNITGTNAEKVDAASDMTLHDDDDDDRFVYLF